MAGIEPGVKMYGRINLPKKVDIGTGAEINAGKGMRVSITIGEGCDIASGVTISCLDSHKKTMEMSDEIEQESIDIEDHVCILTGAKIFGGTKIGHHSTIGAGVVLPKGIEIPPHTLVVPPAPIIKAGYYRK